ncbi:2-oxoglutarate and iron-dependent oxygenase domain-containing protein 2-like [Liolophura sinensis]|uniref:2-oxoglutarate and iron-dependent oxygenase domain-containing protein 2-like n=1 Tax=Liolophura sinensis TaxID=3198878 RepID=UPI00315963FB
MEAGVRQNESKSYRCLCYFTNNIYLRQYGVHVSYANESQFWNDYGQVLLQRGCDTQAKRLEVNKEIQAEVKRRRNFGRESVQRRETIHKLYKPLYPDIFTLQDKWLDPAFVELASYSRREDATVEGLLSKVTTETGERVYSFPVFTLEFCQRFIELIEDFENSPCPKGRPNTMNQYGVLLDELGFDEDFLKPLREHYLQPISRLLFPDWGGENLDSHKAFIVQYKLSEDTDLSYHYDNAEVTLNVCLGADFSSGNLYFGKMRNSGTDSSSQLTECEHSPGCGILHRGQHRHGAQPIRSGERYNLIVWMRCAQLRNERCPMCDMTPDLVEVEGPGDGFSDPQGNYEEQRTVQVCQLT